MLGHGGIAVALNGVNLNPKPVKRSNVHVARCAGTQEYNVLERFATRNKLGRHVGMIVETDPIAGKQAGQIRR